MAATFLYLVVLYVIVVSHTVKGAGYNEGCDGQTLCNDGPNLKCQDGTCVCEDSFYYNSLSTNCVEKSEIGESCADDTQCVETSTCILNGTDRICTCPDEKYKQTNTLCADKKDIGADCAESKECPDNSGCDTTDSTCQCEAGYYEETQNTCAQKKDIGADCAESKECPDNSGCDTTDSTCQCEAGYYEETQNTCAQKKDIGADCAESKECPDNSGCDTTDSTCQCEAGYYEETQNTCAQKKDIGADCAESKECPDNSGCDTTDSTCQCEAGYYEETQNTCAQKKDIGADCAESKECPDNSGCDTTDSTCQCEAGYYEETQNTCAQKKDIGADCAESKECPDNSGCDTTDSTCQCEAGYYEETQNTCAQKKDIGADCAESKECPDNSGCDTTNSTCQCEAGYYEETQNTCAQKKDIGADCAESKECPDNSGCDTTDSTCQCEAGYYEETQNTCAQKKDIGADCAESKECPDNSGCDTTDSTCQCEAGYYEETQNTCAQKISHGEVCQGVNQSECAVPGTLCRQDSQNTLRCLCAADHFWDTQSQTCKSVDSFQVSVTESTTEETSASLTWTANNHRLSGVTYEISSNPAVGDTDITVNANGGSLQNLSPGTQYTLTITTEVPAYGPYISTETSITHSISTKQVLGSSCGGDIKCSATNVCDSGAGVCRCPSGERLSGSGGCVSVDSFQVSVTKSTTEETSASLTWTSNNQGLSGVTYEISSNPPVGDTDITVNANGGSLQNLLPGTQYSLTITTVLPAYGPYISTQTSIQYPITTKQVLGSSCGGDIECSAPNVCDSSARVCRCPSGERLSGSGSCVGVDSFQVSVTKSTTEETSASLTWTSNNQGLSGVTYEISSNPPVGDTDITVNANGGSLQNLLPGTQYSLTITTVLPAYGPYISTQTSIQYPITTKQEHGGSPCGGTIECSVPSVCDSSAGVCRCPSGERLSGSGSCVSVDSFQVSDTKSTTEETSASLTWTSNNQGLSGVTYEISSNPPVGDTDITVNANGGSLQNLLPGTQYSLTITTVLPTYGPYISTQTSIQYSITTKQVHGSSCDGAIECSAPSVCETSAKICRCPSGERLSGSGSCVSEDKFKVRDVEATTQTSSATLTWTADKHGLAVTYSIGVSPDTGGISSSAKDQGGNIQGLTPGMRYTLTITSTVAEDTVYSPTIESVEEIIWMKPAKPVGNGRVNKTSDKVYDFLFDGSPGDVDHYLVTIEGITGSPFRVSGSQTKIPDLQLIPAQLYTYTIVAVNGNGDGDTSEKLEDTFTVGEEKPGRVSNLMTAETTDLSARVEWTAPADPNGNLTGYLITYYENSNSQQCLEIQITCSDCADEWPTRSDANCQRSSSLDMQKSNDFLNDKNLAIVLNITGLNAYRDYTVEVRAVNKAGFGVTNTTAARTEIGVAEPIKRLDVTNTGTSTTAGINLNWTPGQETGPTDFIVKIEREDSIDSGTYKEVNSTTLTGFDSTSYSVNDLLAYWKYRVSVTARTSKGSSEPSSKIQKTISNKPGLVEDFDVQLDENDAQKFTLTFGCPLEEERRGQLVRYIVRKREEGDNGPGSEETINHSNTCTFTTGNFGPRLTVTKTYTFQVAVVNAEYTGDFNTGVSKTIVAKDPQLVEVGDIPVIKGPSETQLTEEFLSVQLCRQCLLDSSQGEITDIGVLVCIRRDNRDCPNLPQTIEAASKWSEAKSGDSSAAYLASQNLMQKLTASQDDSFTFVVGNQRTCNSNTHCNGPLPDDSQVSIIVIACTTSGCTKLPYGTVYVTKASTDDGAPVAAIVGGIAAVLLIVLLVLVGVYLWRRRQGIPRARKRHSAVADPEPMIRRERPVRVRGFKDALANYHKDAKLLFQDDFEDIKKLSGDLKHTSDEAKREENRVKNRYVDILPYDHSRVKLSVDADENETMDFINANYIPGFNSVREYIATQGPMYSTIPDFWRMMWEQNSKIIVMLSDLQEANKRKVDLYWPENLNEPINYGNIVVEMTNFSQLNKYTIRNFKISWGDSEPRKVTHFFLAGWMDFSANLKFSDVLEFAKLVRQEAKPTNSGPITVHCSAGVGRTGTFIALDYFMQYLDKHGLDGEIDIFSYVMRMRYNRPRMVQAESQYIFIYDALNEVIQQKLKEEEEHTYNNVRNSNVYANVGRQAVEEESIYANTNGQSQPATTHIYDNQAFEMESETKQPPEPDETKTPTTVL